MKSLQLTAFNTMIRKEGYRILRIWPQTLLPAAITMALYFLIFGRMIGSRIGDISGFSYIQFIAPGLIMMAVINNAYANVSSSFFSAKFNRSIEEMMVTPMWPATIIAGYVAGGLLRGLSVGCLVAITALMFTHLHVHHIVLIVIVIMMAAVLFSLAGLINGLFANSFDDISIIPTFVLTPLTYLGGVFFSIERLPDVWRHIAMLNPILYLVNAFRYSILGVSDVSITFSLSVVMAFTSLVIAVCWWCLHAGKGLRH
jgi:ABC-2 type transport system permease protein